MALIMSGSGTTTGTAGGGGTDQVNLGGNETPDFAKMRELKRQRMDDSATATTQGPKPAAETESKSWLGSLGDKLGSFRSSLPRSQRGSGDTEIHAGYGTWGYSKDGSNSIRWSDGDYTFTAVQRAEKIHGY